jgi:hypothetical protein
MISINMFNLSSRKLIIHNFLIQNLFSSAIILKLLIYLFFYTLINFIDLKVNDHTNF